MNHHPSDPARPRPGRRPLKALLRVGSLAAAAVLLLGVPAEAAPPAVPKAAAAAVPAPVPVSMGSIVSAERDAYALAADRSAVYRWSDGSQKWTRIGGPAEKLFAGGAGLFAVDPKTGNLNKYTGTPGSWTKVGGPGRTFAVTNDHLYGLAPDGSSVREWTGRGTDWRTIGTTPATQLYAGGAGLFATDPKTGNLNKYTGTPGSWTKVGDPGRTFAVTNDHLYGLAPDGSSVHEWTGRGTDWRTIGTTPAAQLYAGGAGLFATDPKTGNLNKYTGKSTRWVAVGGPGADFTATGALLYGLAPNHTSVARYTGAAKDWDLGVSAPVANPATDEQKLQRLGALTASGGDATAAWYAARRDHMKGKPDVFEFNWSTDYCTHSPDKPVGFDFTAACARHDFGYRNYKELIGDQAFRSNIDGRAPKVQVDSVLLQDLRSVCEPHLISRYEVYPTGPARLLCLKTAQSYYAGVTIGG
ncbi:phospholipase A2 [Kitasatospora sp. NPDC101183]|uniref:phospholipase A2 n=1 Tax=Kitasatospora sp. NPDC101183 TaxID=3364100 RepID=UPI00382182D9